MDLVGTNKQDLKDIPENNNVSSKSPLKGGLNRFSDEFLSEESALRSKSSHRLTFEAQVKVIKERIGDLETIRFQLGLSQRKMTQLLMVDPSAWTRWTRRGEDAPPHIYRSLQWYLALQDKLPGMTPAVFLPTEYYSRKENQLLKQIHEESNKRTELESLISAQSVLLEDQNRQLQLEVSKLKKRLNIWLLSFVGLFFLVLLYKFLGPSF